VCTFEEKSCLFDDDLALKERWMITASTVRKWDNTLDIGVFAFIMFTADCKNKPRTVPDLQILCVCGGGSSSIQIWDFLLHFSLFIAGVLYKISYYGIMFGPFRPNRLNTPKSYTLCKCKLELVGLIYMH